MATIIASISALAWSMTLLFILQFIASIFLCQFLQSEIAGAEKGSYTQHFLFEHFGTWTRSMLSMFEITMAPGGFLLYTHDPSISHTHVLYGFFLMFYVCMVTFAITRIISAMFLQATISTTENDKTRTAYQKAEQRMEWAGRLKSKVDIDDSGGINQEEFMKMLDIPYMEEWVDELGLTEHLKIKLFQALDARDMGEVGFEEIVKALVRMRAPMQPVENVIWHLENSSLIARLRHLQTHVRENGIEPKFDSSDGQPRKLHESFV